MPPKIAVIDDNAGLRQSLKDLLRSLGYVVDQFGSAEEFLSWVATNDVSCIICDVKMPGMKGDELQAQLVAQGRTIPMIFLTAYPQESVRARVLAAGAIGFLTKPFRQDNFIECLKRALAAPHLPHTPVSTALPVRIG